MTMLRSEKVKKENELKEYLNANGGFSNSMIGSESSIFKFDVLEKSLMAAIDRFSSFFAAPLMLRESMWRGIMAVELEFQEIVNDDDQRIKQLLASKAACVASNFSCGNRKSLTEDVGSEKLYEAAREFRDKFYVASNMFLCIQSGRSLDRLQKTTEEFFSGIPSGSMPKQLDPVPIENLFTADFFTKMLYVKPKGEECKLYMTFVMPSMLNHYKTKPHIFLKDVIGHEGAGSLSSYLREK